MKKKIIALLLMVVLSVGVTACGATSLIKDALGDIGTDVDSYDDYDDEEYDDYEDEEDTYEDDVYEDESVFVEEDVEEVLESEGVLVFDVPEGMVYNEETNQYVSSSTGAVANINYLTNPNDGSFYTTTQEMMEEALESSLTSGLGADIDINIVRWDYITIDGYDAVSYQFEYLYNNMKLIQIQVIVNGTDQLHFVTFTSLENEGYVEKFNACIDTFRFE